MISLFYKWCSLCKSENTPIITFPFDLTVTNRPKVTSIKLHGEETVPSCKPVL